MSNKIRAIIVVIIIAICGGCVIHQHHRLSQATTAYQASQGRNVLASQVYDKHVRSTERQALKKYGHKDPAIKTLQNNQRNNDMIQKPFNKFFNVFCNWDNHQSYIHRANKLTNIAGPQVLGNKKFFDADKDNSGQSIIENEAVASQFDNVNLYIENQKGAILTVVADVQYDSWHTDNANSENNHGTGATCYKMTYDTFAHKITSMTKLYNIPNINEDS